MTALIILGLSLVLVGPVLVVVIRSLRDEKARVAREERLRREGKLGSARLLTLGQSTSGSAYPGNCVLLRLELELLDPIGVTGAGTSVTIDQAIPKIALAAFVPGATVRLRAAVLDGVFRAFVDLEAMGYR